MKADYEHFRPFFTRDTVVIFHDDDWAGIHRLITEKVEAGDIAILQQADSLVVCRYTGPVQVKLNPDDFDTLQDEDGNEIEIPDGGDLAEAIATAMGVPGDLLSDAEPSTVSAAKEVRKPAKPRKKK